MVKRVLKYATVVIAIILLLLLAAIVITQTAYFREKIRKELISWYQSTTKLQLEIKEIDGNLFNRLIISEISISDNDSIIIHLSTLKLDYNLWSLVQRDINIDTILLVKPNVNLYKYPDSTWSINALLPEQKTGKETQKSTFPYNIELNNLIIENGSVITPKTNDNLPNVFKNIYLNANGSYNSSQIRVELKHLGFLMQHPDFYIKNIQTSFTKNQSEIKIDQLFIQTQSSNLILNGNYDLPDEVDANMQTEPISKNDIQIFVPGITLNSSLYADVQLNSGSDSTILKLDLTNKNQLIGIQLQIDSLNGYLKKEVENLPFQARINFLNVVPEQWIGMDESKALINGYINLNGSDLVHPLSDLYADGNLSQSVYNNEKIERLIIKGHLTDDAIKSDIQIQTLRGAAAINGTIQNLKTTPQYDVLLTSDSLNISSFFPNIKGTIFKGQAHASGTGKEISSSSIKANVQLQNSSIFYIPVDHSEVQLILRNNLLHIDSITANAPGINLCGSGYYHLNNDSLSAQLNAHIDSLKFINHYMSLPIYFDTLLTQSDIYGTIKNLHINGTGSAVNLNGYSSQLKKLFFNYNGSISDDSINTRLTLNANNLSNENLNIDTVKSTLQYLNNQIIASISATDNDLLKMESDAIIDMNDTTTILLNKLIIETKDYNVYLPKDSQLIKISDKGIIINNLQIKDRFNPQFSLDATADVDYRHNNNINISIHNLNLYPLNHFLKLNDSVSGELTTNISLSGDPNDLILKSDLALSHPEYGPLTLSGLEGILNYQNNQFEAELLFPDIGNGMKANVQVPFHFYIDSSEFKYDPPETFTAEIQLDSLKFSEVIDENSDYPLRGMIDSRIKAEGDFKHPQLYGTILLNDIEFSNPNLGTTYKNIQGKMTLNGKSFHLDSLRIEQPKGNLILSGGAEFDSSIVSGNIVKSSLQVKAKSFHVVDNAGLEILIDADSYLKSGVKDLEFGGYIKVIKSDIYLPAIIKGYSDSETEPEQPLLVQAVHKNKLPQKDTVSQIDQKLYVPNSSERFKNAKGSINLDIPYNSWLRSENMNLELEGDLDILKSGLYFELFGSINISRGYYLFYGKKFNIKEGQLSFQGGKEIDPDLNLSAEHIFRDSEKNSHTMILRITGHLTRPEFEFRLDNVQIPESEAMSILIFGKTSDDLMTSGNYNIAKSYGSNMISQMLATELNKTLGGQLNLDYLEVDWQNASFIVGRYITNDLFITYKRGFGETEGDEITQNAVTLEYRLNRILHVRLESGTSRSSGLDVIMKFQKKTNNKTKMND